MRPSEETSETRNWWSLSLLRAPFGRNVLANVVANLVVLYLTALWAAIVGFLSTDTFVKISLWMASLVYFALTSAVIGKLIYAYHGALDDYSTKGKRRRRTLMILLVVWTIFSVIIAWVMWFYMRAKYPQFVT